MDFDTKFDLIDPMFLMALALPGFVALGVYDKLVPSMRRTTGKSLLEVILFGTLNGALTAPVWLWMADTIDGELSIRDRETWMFLWAEMIIAGLVAPATLGIAAAKIPKAKWIRPHIIDPTPTAWDAAMERREAYFVRFHMRDGRRIGGFFGSDSFASSYPHPPDMYVQELWFLDEEGQFVRPAPHSRGVVIRAEDCAMIELIAAHPEPHGRPQATESTNANTNADAAPRRLSTATEFSAPSDATGPDSNSTGSATDASHPEE